MKQYRFDEEQEHGSVSKESRNKKVVLAMGLLIAVVAVIVVVVPMMKKNVVDTERINVSNENTKETKDELSQNMEENQWDEKVTEIDSVTGISYAKLETKYYYTAYIAVDDKTMISKEKLDWGSSEPSTFISETTGRELEDGTEVKCSHHAYQFKLPYTAEDGVVKLTYLLENCPGTYQTDNTKGDTSWQKKGFIYRSIPVTVDFENRMDAYFLIPCVYENTGDDRVLNAITRELIMKARVRVEATFADGNTEVTYYGFEPMYEYNNNTLNVYALEVEE